MQHATAVSTKIGTTKEASACCAACSVARHMHIRTKRDSTCLTSQLMRHTLIFSFRIREVPHFLPKQGKANRLCGVVMQHVSMRTHKIVRSGNCKGMWTHREQESEIARGCSFFRPRNVFFQTARLVHLVFGRGMSFFRPPALYFNPAMRPRKRAQSFFQPLCIILSSLFLGPETSCSEPRTFFRTPRHLFLDLRCFFRPLPERRTHKAR